MFGSECTAGQLKTFFISYCNFMKYKCHQVHKEAEQGIEYTHMLQYSTCYYMYLPIHLPGFDPINLFSNYHHLPFLLLAYTVAGQQSFPSSSHNTSEK